MYIPQGKYFYFPPNYLYFKSKGKRFHQNFNKVYPQNKPIKLRPNYSITKWRSKLNPKLRYKQMMREYWEKRVPKKSYYYPNINTHKEDQRMYPTKATKYQIKHYGIENALNVINNQPIRRLFDKPLIASPQAAMSSECVACDKSGMDCMLFSVASMALCGIAGFIVPSLALTALGRPFLGLTVSGGDVCHLITAPRSIQCTIDRLDCYRIHSCGLLPDFLAPKTQRNRININ